jgi:hypothetical protein
MNELYNIVASLRTLLMMEQHPSLHEVEHYCRQFIELREVHRAPTLRGIEPVSISVEYVDDEPGYDANGAEVSP